MSPTADGLANLQETINDLRRQLAERTAERDEALPIVRDSGSPPAHQLLARPGPGWGRTRREGGHKAITGPVRRGA